MTEFFPDGLLNEPERYELHEDSPAWELGRREFFRIAGGGLVVAFLLRSTAAAQPLRGGRRGGALPQEIGAWLHVGAAGNVTAYTGKVEIGQNIRTSLSQAVAEELRVPVARVRMVMADTAHVPFDFGTAGSQSTPMMASQLHRVAAAAREALLDMAAVAGKLERDKLTVAGGKVVGPKGEPSFVFGELTKGQKLMKLIGDNPPVTPASRWAVAGTSVPKVEGREFVTGAHRYASDVRRPGMLFGKVLRPPGFNASLISVETATARGLPGVTVVRDGDLVGVVAPTAHAAGKALAAIRGEYKTVPQPSAAELFKYLKEHPATGRGAGWGGGGGGARGSVDEGLKGADQTARATYTVAYVAHVPMEPRVGLAEWDRDRLTVWTGTQRPFGVRGELAAALGVPAETVRVVVPDMGSGYGGKHTGEAAVEAARLARAVGKPVQVAWTREEEFTWAYFRPAGVIELAAGAKKDGTLTAWEAHNYNSGASSLRTPYEVANQRSEFHGADSPLRQGSYRALAATANVFARESHMDDLAHSLGLDPLGFRLKNLKEPRLAAVFRAAAKRFGWGQSRPAPGHGFGLAGGTEKGSYVATCAEVAVDARTGQVRVVRVVTAFECGAAVNPDHLMNQVEGATMMGLGGALFERIDFAGGRVLNPRLADYRVPRFRDTPKIEVVLVDRKDLPSAGAGETPIVAVAPAVGNAIFRAAGVRLRSLPMAPDGIKPS